MINTSKAVRQTPKTSGIAKQQLQGDGGADHLGEVAGDDRKLAEKPQGEGHRRGIMVAAGLREIPTGRDAESNGKRLQQDRHEVGKQNDEQQSVAERRAAGDVGRPVARIHVADGDQIARPREGEQAAP